MNLTRSTMSLYKSFSLVFIIALCGHYIHGQYKPPSIFPVAKELLRNNTQNISLTCSGVNSVRWKRPNNLIYDLEGNLAHTYTTFKHEKSVINNNVSDTEFHSRSTLRIYNISYNDVGYYHCVEFSNENSSIAINSTYVYVYDPDKLSVLSEFPYLVNINKNNQQVVLPCRPTYPDVEVILRKSNGTEITLGSRDEDGHVTTFDPKIGFTISNITLSDSNIYECIFIRKDQLHIREVFLIGELSPSTIIGPYLKTITDNGLVDGKLTLRCTLSTFGLPLSLPLITWSLPTQNKIYNSTRVNHNKLLQDRSKSFFYKYLVMNDTTQGEYSCIANTSDQSKTYSISIPFANSEQLPNPQIENKSGGPLIVGEKLKLKCVLKTKTLQPVAMRWSIPNKNRFDMTGFREINYIREGHKDKSNMFTVFEIKNTTIQDEGNYTCIVIFNNYNHSSNCTTFIKFIDESSHVNYTYIVAIPVVTIIVLAVLVTLLLIKLKKEKQYLQQLILSGAINFKKGDLTKFEPELGIENQTELLPYNNSYEFSRKKLKLGKSLHSGTFGVIVKANATGIVSKNETTTVVVKMVKKDADPTHLKALLSELKIMIHLEQHVNVVNLLGACTNDMTKQRILVIFEYCRYGSLRNYLLLHRHNYVNQINTTTGSIDYGMNLELCNNVFYDTINYDTASSSSAAYSKPESVLIDDNSIRYRKGFDNYENHKSHKTSICTQDLVLWAFQIARGMEYLASKKVLHGDLATRNILLADDNVVKICNFGLENKQHHSHNHQKKNDRHLSFKWMAIESIRDYVFSAQSDIWSYGIVLWEIFSLAQTPYPCIHAVENLYRKLVEGYRMESPPYAPRDIYQVMCNCWNTDPLLRPSFKKIAGTVGLLLEEHVRQHYYELNNQYLRNNVRKLTRDSQDSSTTNYYSTIK